jgi:hypothetical protein
MGWQIAVAGVLAGAWGGRAEAQSFSYRPTNGYVNVPFVLDAISRPAGLPEQSEFARDPWGNIDPGLPSGPGTPAGITQRIVANTRLRYRLIGSPYLRAATVRFSWFWMNPVIVGSSNDRVELQWFYGAPTQLSSGPTYPANLSVAASGNNTLMWPGMVFTTITGPDESVGSPPGDPDTESWGYISQDVQVWGNGTVGAVLLPTLGLYDSAIGVAMTTDDVVDAAVATTGHPVSVVLRLPAADIGSGVILWARCGALPTATAWDRRVPTNATGGSFFQMDVCPAGQQLFVSVTNTSTRARVQTLRWLSSHGPGVRWCEGRSGVECERRRDG